MAKLTTVLFLLTAIALVRCESTDTQDEPEVVKVTPPAQEPHKYKVGDCLMIVDLPNGETESRFRVRVEAIKGDRYIYRWFLEDIKQWALDTNEREFRRIESISQLVNDCIP